MPQQGLPRPRGNFTPMARDCRRRSSRWASCFGPAVRVSSAAAYSRVNMPARKCVKLHIGYWSLCDELSAIRLFLQTCSCEVAAIVVGTLMAISNSWVAPRSSTPTTRETLGLEAVKEQSVPCSLGTIATRLSAACHKHI